MNQCSDGNSREHAGHTVFGHDAEDVAEAVARYLLKPLAHHFHAVEEEADSTEETDEVNDGIIHRKWLMLYDGKISEKT